MIYTLVPSDSDRAQVILLLRENLVYIRENGGKEESSAEKLSILLSSALKDASIGHTSLENFLKNKTDWPSLSTENILELARFCQAKREKMRGHLHQAFCALTDSSRGAEPTGFFELAPSPH